MPGVIADDVIGTVHEARSVKPNGFDLFMDEVHVSDDRVLTVAAA